MKLNEKFENLKTEVKIHPIFDQINFLDVTKEEKDNEKELRSFVDKDEKIKNKIIEEFKKVFLT